MSATQDADRQQMEALRSQCKRLQDELDQISEMLDDVPEPCIGDPSQQRAAKIMHLVHLQKTAEIFNT